MTLRTWTAATTSAALVAALAVTGAVEASAAPSESELRASTAYWLSDDYIGWDADGVDGATQYRLYSAPQGGLTPSLDDVTDGTSYPLTVRTDGLPAETRETFPAQAGLTALELPAAATDAAARLLTGQVAVAALDDYGNVLDAAGLQTPGVLDDLNAGAAGAELGPTWDGDTPSLALWAPTAQEVSVQLYADGGDGGATGEAALTRGADGVWSVTGEPGWKDSYYLFTVSVYVPETGRVERNVVTDPYSLGLSTNGTRSLLVDLDDAALSPDGWDSLAGRKPTVADPVEQTITETHVRDFSVADPTVPAEHRGSYVAFTDAGSNAVQNLRRLADAGTTALHLLPTNDFATRSVNEDRSAWQEPACDLPSFAPDSEQQQECITAVAGSDAYNWGYDPQHYTTPEGSYATDPSGGARTREFRDMVSAVNSYGLGTVIDVVYNHTADSGQSGTNNLDRIVPGYYHRLDADGEVTTSTCCADTASEHLMMGKLLVDSSLTWATEYKVDGMRFDLMGFHPKAVMVELRQRLDALTVDADGVDGSAIFVYGEGWNFGTVADDALFVQATQANLGGTGIATFNDRIRDAVRGGRFDDVNPLSQGYASGLFTDPNGDDINGDTDAQRDELARKEDQIKVGLTGNLAGYTFTDRTGATVTGSDVDYEGSPAGYTEQPGEAVNYVDAHDDQTLFDLLTYKLPIDTSMDDRIRMQSLALSTVALSQGASFWQYGTDALRSKSFNSNSFDSGDWYNSQDPTLRDNGFGRGLPPAADNEESWPFMAPRLADPALKPDADDLAAAQDRATTLLKIRETNPLLHLGSADLVQEKVSFPGSGPDSTPGVIVQRIDDTVGVDSDPDREGLVIVFNATTSETTQAVPGTQDQTYVLNEVQAGGADDVIRGASADAGSFTVPARSVAVFEAR